jgi:hypothetical protein
VIPLVAASNRGSGFLAKPVCGITLKDDAGRLCSAQIRLQGTTQ